MNDKIKGVLLDLLELDSAEQDYLINTWNSYRRMSVAQQIEYENKLRREKRQDSGQRLEIGPISKAPCPCCGR